MRSMLNNALSMFVYLTRGLLQAPGSPMIFTHKQGDEIWQVIVARVHIGEDAA